jgi:hypothetical protein
MPTGASRIDVKWVQGQQNVTGVSVSNAGVVGITERGPIGVRTTVYSKEEFRKHYGGYLDSAESDLSVSVDSFFDNGGTSLAVVRTCHYTDVSDPDTYTAVVGTLDLEATVAGTDTAGSETSSNAATFELAAGDTLTVDPDGGGAQTATFDATAGYLDTDDTYPCADQTGKTLLLSVNSGSTQTCTFGTATTVAELAADINEQISGVKAYDATGELRVESDQEGTGSTIAIVAGGTNTLVWDTPVAGTGDVADISAVTAAEANTLIEADITGATVTIETGGYITIVSDTTGTGSSVQMGGTAVSKFGFDGVLHSGTSPTVSDTLKVDGKTPGTYANDLSIIIAAASNGDAEYFNMSVTENGSVVESWANLTMDSAAVRYAVTIVNHETNGSDLIELTDYDLVGGGATATQARPNNGTFGPLTGGDDGLTSIADADFVGSEAGYTGLYALDDDGDIRLVSIPGRASATVHSGLNTYITHRDKELYVVHPTPTAAQVATASAMKTWAQNYLYGTSEFACCAWPRILISNPSTAVFGSVDTVTIGPEMAKMGRFAYNDRNNADGVLVSTAGIKDDRGVIQGCLGVELDDLKYQAKADLIADVNIEPIRKFSDTAYHFDGGDNLLTTGDWPRQWHSRGAIWVVQSIKKASRWVQHSKNNPKNRGDWERQGSRFLETIPADALDEDRETYWQVSEALNDPAIRAQQRMRGKLGLGWSDDAKYVEIIVTRTVTATA